MSHSSSWSISNLLQFCVRAPSTTPAPTPPPVKPFEQRVKQRITDLQDGRRRRVSDTIEAAFHEACLTGDLETASDLLLTLERMNKRAPEVHGSGFRRKPIPTELLREELANAGIAQATMPPRWSRRADATQD